MAIYVGVSGFSYPSWKGKFYPASAKSEELLSHYSRLLSTVEINSSFYAAPSTAMVKGWAEKTGENFRFSVKAPRQITHITKLGKGSDEAALKLSKTLDSLGQKRGPVLFQLPPFLKQDLGLLQEFLSKTKEIKDRVFEFRHESWLQEPTYEVLERNGTGFCIAETEDMQPVMRVTGEFAYFRLRKDSYDAKAIDQWAVSIAKVTKGSRDSFVYLRHDETGENGVLAQRLSEKLGT